MSPLLVVPRVIGFTLVLFGLRNTYQWRRHGPVTLPGRVVMPLVIGGSFLLLSVIIGLGLNGRTD